ncbi:MAG TPA: ABC transporter transmembrane domain-containing protein, partial [Nevskiaceae bacterium]|nr:ABC transporter transmembrane domain-containing protein [Nevskiaceae bacterium]
MARRGSKAPPSPLPDQPPDWRVLRTLWPYLTEFPLRVILAMLFLVAAKIAGVVLPLMLKKLVDGLDIARGNVAAVPLALLLGYGAMRFANVIFGELRDVVFGRVAERAMRRSALDVFRHLHQLDLEFHLTRRTGGLSRDIERGVAGISFLLRFMLFNIIPTLLEIGMVAAILLVKYGSEFAVIIGGAVGLYIFLSVAITEWRTKYVREANQLDSRAQTRAVDSLLNYETVKYFGNEQHEAAEYDKFMSQWERAQQQQRLSLSALNGVQALIVALSLTWLMILASKKVAGGTMTLGDFTAVNAYIIQLFIPLNFLGFVYREIRRALTDMSRMFGLQQQKARIADAPGAQVLAAGTATVEFEHVRFAYGERAILHDVSFAIPAGKKLAVVGPSGAGKSTLARLLFRFYDAAGGAVKINGIDIRRLTQASLRAHIGVVPQDTVLFNDTIYYNIAYGRTGAAREDVERAARLAPLPRG